MSSRSLILLCSLLIEAMLRERFLLRGRSSPCVCVTERQERAEFWRLGRVSEAMWSVEPRLRELLTRSRGAKFACVGFCIFWRHVLCFVRMIARILLNRFKLLFSISVARSDNFKFSDTRVILTLGELCLFRFRDEVWEVCVVVT